MPSTLTLLPLQAPGSGLTRLAGTLSAAQRAELAVCMLADVVAALRGAGLQRLVALTADPAAAEAAQGLGLDTRPDPAEGPAGIDAAVAAAVAAAGPREAVAVVMPDLPTLSGQDVAGLLEPSTPVVVAPTGDGGTGGLLRRPGGVMPTGYGPRSARRHLELARERGLPTTTVHRAGFERDVDTAEDLRSLPRAAVGAATGALLADLADRLPG